MKLQLLSDLHLETDASFAATPAADADLLVLAGDIGSYQTRHDGSVMDEADWGLRRFSPLPQYGGWPVPVLYVPGNHEYDALDVDETHRQLRQTCDRLGITWLERETLVLDRVRFVGTTLWSDFDALADHEQCTDLTRRLRLRHCGPSATCRVRPAGRSPWAYRAWTWHCSESGCHRYPASGH